MPKQIRSQRRDRSENQTPGFIGSEILRHEVEATNAPVRTRPPGGRRGCQRLGRPAAPTPRPGGLRHEAGLTSARRTLEKARRRRGSMSPGQRGPPRRGAGCGVSPGPRACAGVGRGRRLPPLAEGKSEPLLAADRSQHPGHRLNIGTELPPGASQRPATCSAAGLSGAHAAEPRRTASRPGPRGRPRPRCPEQAASAGSCLPLLILLLCLPLPPQPETLVSSL